MGSFNQMCMVSNIPVKPETSVKLFFLVSNGDYRNQKTIMTGVMPNPWSAFKVFGGIGIDAIYRGYNRFDVIENEKSYYLLDLLKKLTCDPDMDFSKVFELIEKGELLCRTLSRENVFMNFACVHRFAYDELINHGEKQKISFKKILTDQISKINEVINKNFNNSVAYETKEERVKDLMLRHMNFFEEYTPTCLDNDLGKCSFYLFSQYKPEFTDNEVFSYIIDDILFMDGLYELGVTLSPKVCNHELASEKLRENVMSKGLSYFMNDYFDEDYVEVKKKVSVIQEIKVENIKEYFEVCGDFLSEHQKGFECFLKENASKNKVYIEASKIKDIAFLSAILQDNKHDVILCL